MIYNSNNLDIFAVRKDGGADLVIISSGSLDDSATTQTHLLDKIENYLNFIQGENFRKECPYATKNNIHIILTLKNIHHVL